MCLINRYEAHFHSTQLVQKHRTCKAFRRDVQEFVSSKNAVFQDGQHHFVLHMTGNVSSLYASTTQSLNLILHQRNERRKDYADTFHREGWHLKRYALSSASRHQAKSVTTSTYALYDLSLNATKIFIAPVLSKYGKIIFFLHFDMISHREEAKKGFILWALCLLSAAESHPVCGCFPRCDRRCRRLVWSLYNGPASFVQRQFRSSHCCSSSPQAPA